MNPTVTRWGLMFLVCLGAMTPAVLGGEGPGGGRPILTESSVWRTHATWGPVMQQADGEAHPAKIHRQMQFATAQPPGDWAGQGFDDGGWGLWRETHAAERFKGTEVPLYDTWQYGVQQSPHLRRRCLRGRFEVADPSGVKGLKLTVVYRGGLIAYVNGQEIGRGHLSEQAAADPLGSAEGYSQEAVTKPDGKPWEIAGSSISSLALNDEATVVSFNQRMRTLSVEIPGAALRKGVNVLALDVRAAPSRENAGDQFWWSACGVASIDLRGEGAVTSSVERPAGVQVWAASPLLKVGPHGNVSMGRVSNGRLVLLWNFPLCWANPGEGTGSIRLVGARNGAFCGQVVVSSAGAIRGLKAVASDLVQAGGGGRIAAADCRVSYMGFPPEPPALPSDPAVSLLDALYDEPAAEYAALPAKPFPGAPDLANRNVGLSWSEGGATVPVWLRVRVPKDTPAGDYTGTLTVSAEGLPGTAVPVSLKVQDYLLPDPREFTPHVGLVHSPDSIALQYKVPLWSDRHFELMEKTCARMGEAGGSVVFIPLATDTWLGNAETMVRWVKDGDGYKGDFAVLDRYLDLVQKHMKPRAVCLYVYHPGRKGGEAGFVNSPDGRLPVPAYGTTPEATAFWKPVIDGTLERLKTRGLDGRVVLGLSIEGGGRDNFQPVVDLFKELCPEGKWADLAHFGAKKLDICGVPYGYVMSVWGNESPIKSKRWGASDLPFVLLKHYRADPVIDLRPTASRASMYMAVEVAMGETFWGRGGPTKQTQGIGPLGMDFWNFSAAERNGRQGSLEGGISNLGMSSFSTAAFLAPGPEGPLSTARFEMFRQGLQACEAAALLQNALADGKLDGALAKRCTDVLKGRQDVLRVLGFGEPNAQGEGWRWFESSGWTDLEGELFATAGEVAKALGK